MAKDIVKSTRSAVRGLTTRSPLRSSNVERERIRQTFERARLDACPLGLVRAGDDGSCSR